MFYFLSCGISSERTNEASEANEANEANEAIEGGPLESALALTAAIGSEK